MSTGTEFEVLAAEMRDRLTALEERSKGKLEAERYRQSGLRYLDKALERYQSGHESKARELAIAAKFFLAWSENEIERFEHWKQRFEELLKGIDEIV